MRGLAAAVMLWMALAVAAQAQLHASDGVDALQTGDTARARAVLEPLAERGGVLAQYNMGVLALRTGGKARRWFRAAAEQGHAPAQQALAGLAADAQDWSTAARWYRAAAAQGVPEAALRLGRLHDRGLFAGDSAARAERWYRRAARAGLAPAQFALGALLADRGATAAAAWFARAASAGHPQAQFNHARNLEADAPAAARGFYAKAAGAGVGQASYNLALMLARGQGGAASFRHALAWARTAQAQGYAQGATLADALAQVMAPDARDAAQAMGNECAARPAACLPD